MGFSFGRLGHSPGVGLEGTLGGLGGQKNPKFNQIWCVRYLQECHIQRHHCLGPGPLGPWGGAERSNIIKSILQSQFKDFLTKLCASSHKWKIYNISDGIFIRLPGSCPGVGLGGTVGGWRVKKNLPKFNQIWCVSYLHEWHMHQHNILGPHPLRPRGGVKNLIFWTWSCGISNLRGWAVDQDTLKIFNLWSSWWPWDGVKGSITIRFLWEHGDLRWHAIECVLVYPFYVSGAYLLYYK